ncbi:MAG: uroporphyrinogen decarboxylase family protein [Thermoplasmata archaeon]|nr:uroporphyrinogen decarboxylase family protein [Thermoplasmata archaeon]
MTELTPYERAVNTIFNEKVDELAAYPIACGVLRKLLPGTVTYREWASDPEVCARAFVEGYNTYRFPFTVALVDLSLTASDLGAHVRMDTENTPFVDKPVINDLEDYERIQAPDVHQGRVGKMLKMNEILARELREKSFTISFLEGPLLTLSQSAGAERLFMDMYDDPSAVHRALSEITTMCVDGANAVGETGMQALCWDYLWANYSCLGDSEYAEFEADKYAKACNEATVKAGLGFGIHNCADLPHLDTQIRKFKPQVYSLAYYPLVPDSLSAAEVIDRGYADDCAVFGNIDPQLFVRGTREQIAQATASVTQEVKTALCRRGLNSHFGIASGCEVPPDFETKLENIQAVMDTVHEHGRFQ